MKNAMQLKAIVKNIAKENIGSAGSSELYAGTLSGKGFSFEISGQLHY